MFFEASNDVKKCCFVQAVQLALSWATLDTLLMVHLLVYLKHVQIPTAEVDCSALLMLHCRSI